MYMVLMKPAGRNAYSWNICTSVQLFWCWKRYWIAGTYKYSGTDQIQAELNKGGGVMLCSEIHKLVSSIWIKE
jgi:hypothetical protein